MPPYAPQRHSPGAGGRGPAGARLQHGVDLSFNKTGQHSVDVPVDQGLEWMNDPARAQLPQIRLCRALLRMHDESRWEPAYQVPDGQGH